MYSLFGVFGGIFAVGGTSQVMRREAIRVLCLMPGVGGARFGFLAVGGTSTVMPREAIRAFCLMPVIGARRFGSFVVGRTSTVLLRKAIRSLCRMPGVGLRKFFVCDGPGVSGGRFHSVCRAIVSCLLPVVGRHKGSIRAFTGCDIIGISSSKSTFKTAFCGVE